MSWPKDVRRKDLRVDTFRCASTGGQNGNKVSSGVRITHLPTGTVGESRVHRDQPQNKREAFRKLAAQLVPLMKAAATPECEVPAKSDERVRSFDLEQHRVVDHRLGKEHQWRPEDVLDGDALAEIQTLVLLSGPDQA